MEADRTTSSLKRTRRVSVQEDSTAQEGEPRRKKQKTSNDIPLEPSMILNQTKHDTTVATHAVGLDLDSDYEPSVTTTTFKSSAGIAHQNMDAAVPPANSSSYIRNKVEEKPISRPRIITPHSSVLDMNVSAEVLQKDSSDETESSDESFQMETLPPLITKEETCPSIIKKHTDLSRPLQKPTKLPRITFLLASVLMLALTKVYGFWGPTPVVGKDSVCVPGGGFSGFWFTLGRLKSIPDPTEKDYYCYSAGCLGVVATLSNYTMEEMLDIALDAQTRWKTGEISRYDVVGSFIHDLLYGRVSNSGKSHSHSTVGDNSFLLSRLNIMTSVRSGWGGLDVAIRSPKSLKELQSMLVQTTWIPYAVGDDLFHDEHMDGAFSFTEHPNCEHHVGLALDIDLFLNIVNVNLGRKKVEKFWNAGLAYGL